MKRKVIVDKTSKWNLEILTSIECKSLRLIDFWLNKVWNLLKNSTKDRAIGTENGI